MGDQGEATTAAFMEQPAPLQQQRQQPTNGEDQVQYALVPFSFRNPFHDALRDEVRRFPIANQQILIRQGWKNDGKGGTKIGFGASVYDASIALSLYLDSNRDVVRGKRVIELGCGPGLVGIVASKLHARSVVITDGDPASVALTASNIQLNTQPQAQAAADDDGAAMPMASPVQAEEYLWGDAKSAVLQHAPYDVILGADIVACPYAGAFDALLDAFTQLSDDQTELLLAYKLRHGSENVFFDKFEELFDVHRVPDDHLHIDFQQSDIVIFHAKRRSATTSSKVGTA